MFFTSCRRRFMTIVPAVAVLALLTACGSSGSSSTSSTSGQQLTNITFTTTWVGPDFEDIPVWVAQEEGWYRAAGLNVKIIYPPTTTTAPKLLATGNADLGYVETSEALEAVQQGTPIKVIAGVWQKEANALVGRPGTTINPQQLKGKTIATFAGPSNVAELNGILKSAGLNRSDVNVVIAASDNVALVLAGKANYALNAAPYGIAEVKSATGKPPSLLMLSTLGLPQFLQTAYAGNTAWLQSHPSAARAWVAVTLRALEFAQAHPAAAINLYVKGTGKAGSGPVYSSAGWSGVLPLINGPEGLFKMTDQQWTNLESFLKSENAFSGTVPPSEIYTNAYIP
ncbi:MAG: ABC transporter substrate-binding protein [Candidatus Saccharimonadales bacterium]